MKYRKCSSCGAPRLLLFSNGECEDCVYTCFKCGEKMDNFKETACLECPSCGYITYIPDYDTKEGLDE